MEIKIPFPVKAALDALSAHGFEAYLVGGCVRDSVMGNLPNDWDITTSAQPEEVKTALNGWKLIETGIRHGTVTAVKDHMPMEITTFRVDGAYSDSRHPDRVHFTRSLKEDLARRDFTVNALAFRPETGIVDCFGGRKDLHGKIIRCVGEPDRRFREDGLRILRALRFSSVLGFRIETGTSDSVFRNAALLDPIAPERVRVEFLKLLCGKKAVEVLREYRTVVERFLPELRAMAGFPQNNPYHVYDVWEHTLKAVEEIPPQPVLRFTALLHDMGKPECYTQDQKGVGHFHGHGEKSAEAAQRILKRLRFDNGTAERITALVRYHDISLPPQKKILLRRLNRFGEEALRQLFQIKRADILAQNPEFLNRLELLAQSEKLLDEILEQKLCFSLKDLQIGGEDLIESGFPQGPEIGKLLSILLNEVMDGACPNRREALLERAKQLGKAG